MEAYLLKVPSSCSGFEKLDTFIFMLFSALI